MKKDLLSIDDLSGDVFCPITSAQITVDDFDIELSRIVGD